MKTPEESTPARMVPGADATRISLARCNAATYSTRTVLAMPKESAGDVCVVLTPLLLVFAGLAACEQ